jgi:hypothetical protein
MLRAATPAASLPTDLRSNEHRFSDRPKMLFKTISACVYGVDAYLVEVEVDVGFDAHGGLQRGGLPDTVV